MDADVATVALQAILSAANGLTVRRNYGISVKIWAPRQGGDPILSGPETRLNFDLTAQFHNAVGRQAEELHRAFGVTRSEEHTSELQSLMRISYAVFCLKKKHTRSHTQ